jgi:hypothetical protein
MSPGYGWSKIPKYNPTPAKNAEAKAATIRTAGVLARRRSALAER